MTGGGVGSSGGGAGGVGGSGFTPQRKGVEAVRKIDKSPDKILTPHADLER